MNGSISVAALTGPALNFTLPAANSLQFSRDTSFGNYKLQWQTNNLAVGLSTNWVDYPGGALPGVTVPINPKSGTAFFRLVSIP